MERTGVTSSQRQSSSCSLGRSDASPSDAQTVRGPSATMCLTMRPATSSSDAAVPAPRATLSLPPLFPARAPVALLSSTLRPPPVPLHHRWRFIRKEALALVHAGGRELSPTPGASQRGGTTPPKSPHARWKKLGARRGWLEDVLQDDRKNTDSTCMQADRVAFPCFFTNNMNSVSLLSTPHSTSKGTRTSLETPPSLHGESNTMKHETPERALPEVGASTSTVSYTDKASSTMPQCELTPPLLPESPTPDAVVTKEPATAESQSAVVTTPTTKDAVQRLRVALLTASFQRMVDDILEAHTYNAEERVLLVRHARIFCELPLLSRFNEMHPLCNLRIAGSDFRPVSAARGDTSQRSRRTPSPKRCR